MPTTQYEVKDGLVVRTGSTLDHWLRKNKHRLIGLVVRAKPALTPRQRVVKYAYKGQAHRAAIHYSEDADRSGWLKWAKPGGRLSLPFATDCSGFATLCYRLAGLPDPNGLSYNAVGYTGTLLDHAAKTGRIVSTAEAKPGDLIVYGPGTGAHVAVVVKGGSDPLTISHGQESGPELVHVSQDGRLPQRVCRYI